MRQKRMGALLALAVVLAGILGMAVPAAAASSAPAPAPAAAASAEAVTLPLVPGTYESEDGSVLRVKKDGTCTYTTLVSGKINGKPASGRLTFHGAIDGGKITFTRVTYLFMDLTETAASLGLTGEYWEAEAEALYAAALKAA